MKKISVNLLKIGLVLVLGLCIFGAISHVEAAKKQAGATDIEIKKFNTSYGPYEPGVATVKEKLKDTSYDDWRNDGCAVSDFKMFYCSCQSKNEKDFDKNKPHNYKKIGHDKVGNGIYSSDDGKLTLWSSAGKIYFKVSSDNNIEHYRVEFIIEDLQYKDGSNWYKSQYTHKENIDLYCISTDNEDDYNVKPEIKLNKETLELHKGDKAKLTATTNVKNAKVEWASSSNAVTVDQNGNVSAVSNTGIAKITATINVDGKKATAICNVTISLKTPSDSTAGEDKIITFNFKKDDYLKYTAKTNTTWNLRTKGTNLYSTKGSVIKGKIEKDDIVKVTSIPTSGKWVGVEVVTGDLKGTTGDIFFDNNAVKNFTKTVKPTESIKPDDSVDDADKVLDGVGDDSMADLPGLEGIDFGETANGIISVVKMVLGWLTEFLASINWTEVTGTVMEVGKGVAGMISSVISK